MITCSIAVYIHYVIEVNNKGTQGEKPGLVVRAEDSHPRECGFESRHILDGYKQFASYYIKEKLK
jgi:hypothetical protein